MTNIKSVEMLPLLEENFNRAVDVVFLRLSQGIRQHIGTLLPRRRHPLQEAAAGDVRRGVQEGEGQLHGLRQPSQLQAVLLHSHGQQASRYPTTHGFRDVTKIREIRQMRN